MESDGSTEGATIAGLKLSAFSALFNQLKIFGQKCSIFHFLNSLKSVEYIAGRDAQKWSNEI
jgi:hypothetical protein